MLRAPGPDDPDLSWFLRQVNEAQEALDRASREAALLNVAEPERSLRIERYNALRRQIDQRFRQLEKDAATFSRRSIERYYVSGHTAATFMMNVGYDFSLPHQEAIEYLQQDTFDDIATGLRQVRANYAERIEVSKSTSEIDRLRVQKRALQHFHENDLGLLTTADRELIQRASRGAITQQLLTGLLDVEDSAAIISSELWDNDIQIVDRAGRRWGMETYTRMIARTKSAEAYNSGSLGKYAEAGVDRVQVFDGMENDAECAVANGQVWTLKYARQNILAHPNCRRAFGPAPGVLAVSRYTQEDTARVIAGAAQLGFKQGQDLGRQFLTGYRIAQAVRAWEMNPGVVEIQGGFVPFDLVGFFEDKTGVQVLDTDGFYAIVSRALTDLIDPALVSMGLIDESQVPAYVRKDWEYVFDKVQSLARSYEYTEARIISETVSPYPTGAALTGDTTRAISIRTFPAPDPVARVADEPEEFVFNFIEEISSLLSDSEAIDVTTDVIKANVDLAVHRQISNFFLSVSATRQNIEVDFIVEEMSRIIRAPDFGDDWNRILGIVPGRDSLWDASVAFADVLARGDGPVLEGYNSRLYDQMGRALEQFDESTLARWMYRRLADDLSDLKNGRVPEWDDFTNDYGFKSWPMLGPVSVDDWETIYSAWRTAPLEGLVRRPEAYLAELIQDYGGDPVRDAFGAFIDRIEPWKLTIKERAIWTDVDRVDASTLPSILASLGYSNVTQTGTGHNIHGAITIIDKTVIIKVFGDRNQGGIGSAIEEAVVNWMARGMNLPAVDSVAVVRDGNIEYKVARFIQSESPQVVRSTSQDRVSLVEVLLNVGDMHGDNWTQAVDGRVYLWDAEQALNAPSLSAHQFGSFAQYLDGQDFAGTLYSVPELAKNISNGAGGGSDLIQAGRKVFPYPGSPGYRIIVLSNVEAPFVEEIARLTPEELVERWFREGILVGYDPDDAYALDKATRLIDRLQEAINDGVVLLDGQTSFVRIGESRVNIGDTVVANVVTRDGNDLEGMILNHIWDDLDGNRWLQFYDPQARSSFPDSPYVKIQLEDVFTVDAALARVPEITGTPRAAFADYRPRELQRATFSRDYFDTVPTVQVSRTDALGLVVGQDETRMTVANYVGRRAFKFADGRSHEVNVGDLFQRMVVQTAESIAPEYRPRTVELVNGLIEVDGGFAYGIFDPTTNTVRVSVEAGLVYDDAGQAIGYSYDQLRAVVLHEFGHAVDDNVTAVLASRLRAKFAADLLEASPEITGKPVGEVSWAEIGRALQNEFGIGLDGEPAQAISEFLDFRVDTILALRREARDNLVRTTLSQQELRWVRVANSGNTGIEVGAELAADGFAAMRGAHPDIDVFKVARNSPEELVERFRDISQVLVGYTPRSQFDTRVILKRGATTFGDQTDRGTFVLTIADDASDVDIIRAWMQQDEFFPPTMLLAPKGQEEVTNLANTVMGQIAVQYRKVRDPEELADIARILDEEDIVPSNLGDDYWTWMSDELREAMWLIGEERVDRVGAEGVLRTDLEFQTIAERHPEVLRLFVRDLLAADALGNLPAARHTGGRSLSAPNVSQDALIRRFRQSDRYWESYTTLGVNKPPSVGGSVADERAFWGMFYDPVMEDVLTDSVGLPHILEPDWTVDAVRQYDPRWRTLPTDDEGRFTYARLQEHILDSSGRVDDELGWTGGTTIDILTEERPHNGWSVALKEHEEIVEAEDFTPQRLQQFVETHKDVLAEDGYYLGVWYDHEDTGQVFMDVVRVINDDLTAARFGVENKQLAMFNLDTGETRDLSATTMRQYIQKYHPQFDALTTPEALDETVAAASGVLKVNGVPTDVPILAKDGVPMGIRLGSDFDEAIGYPGWSDTLDRYHRLAYRVSDSYRFVEGRKSPIVNVRNSRVVDGRKDAVKERLRIVMQRAAEVYESGEVVSLVGATEGQILTRDMHRFYEIWHVDIRDTAEALSGRLGRDADGWFTRTAAAASAMSPGQDADINILVARNMAEFVSQRRTIRLDEDYYNHVRSRIDNILSFYPEDITKITNTRSRKRVLRFREALEALDASRGKTVAEIDNDTVRLYMGEFYTQQTIGRSYESSIGVENFYPALRVLEGDLSIHEALGASKVRSFYNNIIDPYDVLGMNDSTIDFHMTDASLFVRGSGKVQENKTINYSAPDFESPKLLGISLGFRAIVAQSLRELYFEIDPATGLTWAERLDARSVAQLQEVIWSIWREGKAYGWWGELQLVWPNPNAPGANLPNYRRLGLVRRTLNPPEV